MAQPRLEAWSPDSQPSSSYTNDLDLPNNRTQESIFPWPCDNVTTLSCQHHPKHPPGKRELLKCQHEASPDSTQSRHIVSGTSAGAVEKALPGVTTEQQGAGGRAVPCTQHHTKSPSSAHLSAVPTTAPRPNSFLYRTNARVYRGWYRVGLKFAGRSMSTNQGPSLDH